MNPLLSNVLAFLRGLRRLGFTIGADEEALVLAALEAVGCEDRNLWKTALQAVVVKRPAELPVFDAAWQQFLFQLNRSREPWLARNTLLANVARESANRHRHPDVIWMGRNESMQAQAEDTDTPPWETAMIARGASAKEVLREKDFARLTPLEQQEMSRWRLVATPLNKKSHRTKAARRGKNLDLVRTMRSGFHAGEWLEIIRQARRVRERPVVLICDVSGSMDPYSRMFIRFGHALSRMGIQVETFVFSTRLTRITNALRFRDADRALEEVSAYASDFSSGTRLAETLSTFHRDYARRLLRRGAVVFLATDGFDTGNDEDLRTELARLVRLSQRLIWLNPLQGDPAFEPSARGASTLATFADAMLPGHNWASLENAWQYVEHIHTKPRVRRQTI